MDNNEFNNISKPSLKIIEYIQEIFYIKDISILSTLTQEQFYDLILKHIPGTYSRVRTVIKDNLNNDLSTLGINFILLEDLKEKDGLIGYYLNKYYSYRSELLDFMSAGIRSLNTIPSLSYEELFNLLKDTLENYSISRYVKVLEFLEIVKKLPSSKNTDYEFFNLLGRVSGRRWEES